MDSCRTFLQLTQCEFVLQVLRISLTTMFLLQYADDVQQAFSADKYPTLYNALPAIEKLYSSWEKASKKWKYDVFAPALVEGMSKLNDYYEKTAASDSHIIAMHTCKKFYQHVMTDIPCSPSPWKETQIFYEELGCCARGKSKKFSTRKGKWDIFLNICHV